MRQLGHPRRWLERRTGWWILAGSAVALELAALWFQYGMGLAPCVMCIYERVALLGLVLAGLVGAVAPGTVVFRLAAYLLWAVSAVWGLWLSLEHITIQNDPAVAMSCSFSPDFPAWAKLDEWLPAFFQPTGFCDDIPWRWLDLSMVEWVAIAFALYLATLVVVIAADLMGIRGSRRPSL